MLSMLSKYSFHASRTVSSPLWIPTCFAKNSFTWILFYYGTNDYFYILHIFCFWYFYCVYFEFLLYKWFIVSFWNYTAVYFPRLFLFSSTSSLSFFSFLFIFTLFIKPYIFLPVLFLSQLPMVVFSNFQKLPLIIYV